MAPPKTNTDWFITENIPQLSDDLERRLSEACQFRGLTKEIISEVDEVIKAATKAIRKHHDDEHDARLRELFRLEAVARQEN